MTEPKCTRPPSSPISIAVPALAGDGVYGEVTRIARNNDVTRQRVYRIREIALDAIEQAFGNERAVPINTLAVTEEHMKRAVVALRIVLPASIRDIVEVLPILFGVRWSYGKIQAELIGAGEHAATLLSDINLASINHLAIDEIFSQGQPVLSGIDLRSGFLTNLAGSPTRSGSEWAELLGSLRDEQKLSPKFTVKDAGTGLAAGVQVTWPECAEWEDLFHPVYEMNKVARSLETAAYGAISRVDKLYERREKERLRAQRLAQKKRPRSAKKRRALAEKKARAESRRRSLGQRIRQARERMDKAISRSDRFERLVYRVRCQLTMTERGSGQLRTSKEVREGVIALAREMSKVGGRRVVKLAVYLENRAPGLSLYLDWVRARLAGVTAEAGGRAAVSAAVRAWHASLEVEQGGPQWDRGPRRDEAQAATRHLLAVCGDGAELERVAGLVFPILHERHRASSAIENVHSVLRPYLVVQKSVNQEFLDLFRFYWNTRKRQWGRWKGQSALEVLTGQEHADWLTMLGYPPAVSLRKAA
jgi:hypothetical protein